MKNMKITMKLIVAFVIVIVLAIIVGGTGIVGMTQISNADQNMYHGNLLPVGYVGQFRAQYNIQRAAIRDLAIYPANDSAFQDSLNTIKDSEKVMSELMPLYEAAITTDDDRQAFNTFKNAYNNDFAKVKQEMIAYGQANDTDGAITVMKNLGTPTQAIIRPALEKCMEINSKLGEEAVDGNKSLANIMTILEIVILAIAVVIAMYLALHISSLIGKPTKRMMTVMKQVGETGNLTVSPDLHNDLIRDSEVKDEIGQSILAFNSLIEHITVMSQALETVAGKDLSGKVSSLSDKDTLGNSLIQMQDNLNEIFAEINSSTNQVSTGATQIADGAQLLAQGATEQSATVEELSASIAEIAEQTKHNAVVAGEAKSLEDNIKISAEKGKLQMEQMTQAVRDINEASHSIGKVIKIIDDIAFQTNILALNAAVEAARAGQHGKGFAVVADEVRNLAAKSAEAAKNTSDLIASSIQKAELGAAISDETAASLNQIVEGIMQSSALVADIAKSSNDQATAISQVRDGIDQVSQVVQQNSATAEESAAASEEMSGQATLLQQLISQFKLRGLNNRVSSSFTPSKTVTSSHSHFPTTSHSTGFSINDSSKY